MATIPNSQKFHTVAGTVDTENRGSTVLNAQRKVFTMQDILDTVTVGGGVDGSGTAGQISKWVDANTLGDSIMAETAALITLTGALNTTGEIQCNSLTSSGDIIASASNMTAVDLLLSGSLAAVGGAFSGDVTAVNVTASGNVAAVAGTFSGNVGAVDMVASGNLLVGDATGENPVGINVQQDKGNLAIGMLIHNQNTGADADAKISFETQGAADISIGIDRGDANKFKISRSGNLGVNDEMSVDADGIVANTSVTSPEFNVTALQTAPASATAVGTAGAIVFASDAVYVCVATNTWKKVDIATF
tara:strand:- start:7755 stop:8669 length:915 start_codon:yes stop_codon:yes gene_type:complete